MRKIKVALKPKNTIQSGRYFIEDLMKNRSSNESLISLFGGIEILFDDSLESVVIEGPKH